MGETVFPGSKSKGSIRIGAYASLVNGDTITIGDVTYEFRTSGSADPGNIQVDVAGSGALTVAALVAAIVANPPTPLIDPYVDSVDSLVCRLEAHDEGSLGNVAFEADLTGATNIIDQTSGLMLNGANGSLKHLESGRYIVTALDLTATCIMIPTTLTTPKIVSIQVFSATGLLKGNLTTLWTVSSTRIKGVITGGTDPIATDIVAWSARD